MTTRSPLDSAKRRYIFMALIVLVGYAGLMLLATYKISQAPQLGWGRIVIPALLWGILFYFVWILRKYYLRIDDAALDR